MTEDDFTVIAGQLQAFAVRYIIVGGMAVVAHGYGRMTFDVYLVVALTRDNIVAVFKALGCLGYRPRVPVTAEQFADPVLRHTWVQDKGMQVLSLWSDTHPTTSVDLFVEEPFDFEEAYSRAVVETLENGTRVRFVDIDTLIDMKQIAGRPQDLEDVKRLETLRDG